MSDEFGPTFVTISDQEGNEHELEFVAGLEYDGQEYRAFFPAESEENEDPDTGLVILKIIRENGEELLSTPDSEEELNAVYDRFMEEIFSDDDENEDDEE